MLKGNRTARICTQKQDGTINATPVSYRYINGQILTLTNIKSQKVKNIEQNNDVTVLIDTLDPLRGILIYGTAEIDHSNVYEQSVSVMETFFHGMAKEKVQRITKAYLDAFQSVIVKITPKHITTFDYTKDVAWQNFLKTYLQE